MKRAIIIGSGAVGLCTAYFLQKEGVKVQVISASKKGDSEGCSYGNAGMIVPSHLIPLAAPGVIKKGIKWLLDPRSPLYIKPRFDSDLISWIWKFILSSNSNNVTIGAPLLVEMNQASRDLFKEISESEGLDYKYSRGGLMMLYKTSRYQEEEEHLALKAKAFGLDVEVLNAKEIRDHEDQLQADVLGAVWYKSDAHIIPHKFMEQMIELLEKKGVQFNFNCKVDSFIKENGRIGGIKTKEGVFEADEYIVCAGSWSQEIAKDLAISIPIQGGKGYHLHIKDVPLQLKTPSILCEVKVAMTPMQGDLRVSGTMEFSGLNVAINDKRVEGIKDSVGKYFNRFDPNYFEGLKPWAGLRPVSPDTLPYIGRSKSISNLSFNTGHAMLGLSLAPISGKLLSDLLLKGKTMMNIDRLDPERFN